jgi:DNA transformation protein
MFGGLGVYREGRMFALVADGELYFKTSEATRPAFGEAGGSAFTYEGRGRTVVMSYWTPPAAIFDDDAELVRWSGLAWSAAAEPVRRPRPPRRGSRG